MKQAIRLLIFLPLALLVIGCKKGNYPGATISPYIPIFDVRNIYKGSDVRLTIDNMFGSTKIAAMVVSDHSGGNLPAGLLVVQDSRRLAQLRGISIPLGADAANYKPGDSVIISVDGGLLTKVNGILEITELQKDAVQKVSSNNPLPVNRATTAQILANPGNYESTLSVVVKGGFNPLPAPTDVLSGDKILNDGFGDITLHTEANATFARNPLAFSANYYVIPFNMTGGVQLRLRTGDDVAVLSSAIEVTPVVISGFMSDVNGGDGNYEYIQLKATRDINFATTPFSVVVTNNATAATPTGNPVNGWAMGGMRTYKLNLTSGTAAKGSFFYVGGAGKLINGANSTNVANLNWIRAFNYTTSDGDGFGTKTTGLLANSGNASGIAVFEGTTVTATTRPVDVIFIATGGSLYTAGPPAVGYRIANTDFYDVRNPVTLADQPFYRSGTNTLNFVYNTADLGYFNMLGGIYDPSLGRWTKARTQNNVLLTKTSAVDKIEGEGSTIIK